MIKQFRDGVPVQPGWYFRRRLNDRRSRWLPVKVPSLAADRRDRTALYEWHGPLVLPE